MATKKRQLLPYLNECIIFLSTMSGDMAKLEMTDNDVLSRQLKRKIAEFKHHPFERLTQSINDVRTELRARPKRAYTGKKKEENSTIINQ